MTQFSWWNNVCVSVDLLVDIFFKSFHIWLYFDLSVNIRQTDRQSRLPLTLVVTDEGDKNNYQRELSCLYKEVMNSMLPPPPPQWQFCRTSKATHVSHISHYAVNIIMCWISVYIFYVNAVKYLFPFHVIGVMLAESITSRKTLIWLGLYLTDFQGEGAMGERNFCLATKNNSLFCLITWFFPSKDYLQDCPLHS